jgi:squalene synthase HpnC
MNHTVQPPTIAHYENFPVASVLCPAHLRAPIAAIYHFARTADDLADEGHASAAQRLADLGAYRSQLRALYKSAHSNSPTTPAPQARNATPSASAHAGPEAVPSTTAHNAHNAAPWAWVFPHLEQAVLSHRLPQALLVALLDAFVQDVEKTRDAQGYADEQELRNYCRQSANPVGRLLLHLHGIDDATSLAQSDAICTALQLINFWQDPSRDLPRGRCYFSLSMQERFGVHHQDLLAQRQTPAIRQMIAECVAVAEHTMRQGSPLVHRIPGRAGWELRLVVQGGLRILEKIRALDYATLHQRPQLKPLDYIAIVWRALWM